MINFAHAEVRPINSFEQRVQLPVTVLVDNVLEGVESFGIGMSNNINSVSFLFGDYPSTVVNIVESSKLIKDTLLSNCLTLFISCIILIVGSITVGFERTFTSVSEDVGSFELCVNISTPDITISENVQFSLNLFSIQDTAGMVMYARPQNK